MTAHARTRHAARLLAERFGGRPFALDEADFLDGGAAQVERTVAAGLVRRVCRGWFVVAAHDSADADDAPLRRAIRRLRERGIEPVVAGDAAGREWGLHILGPLRPPMLLVPPGSRVRPGVQSGVLIRHAELADGHVVQGLSGQLVTSVLRTGIDCARGRSPLAAFIVLNSAVRAAVAGRGASDQPLDAHAITELASLPEVREWAATLASSTVADCSGHGLRVVRQVQHLVDPRLETALESLSWWRFDEAGMPLPEPQRWVQGASGAWFRVDFFADGVVGEADGEVKYRTSRDLIAEKRRQSDIELKGHPVVRWTWADAWARPHLIVRAFQRAALPGLPRESD